MFTISKKCIWGGYNYPLCADVTDGTVFQSAGIQKCFFRRAWIYGLKKRMRPCIYLVSVEKKPVLLFPAFESGDRIELAGAVNGISSLCPIYLGSKEECQDALCFFLKRIPFSSIRIPRVIDGSFTSNLLDGRFDWANVEKREIECVKISIHEGYDNWYCSLSKSVRQNLRTAKNRCIKDGHEFRFEMYCGGTVPWKLMQRIVSIYNNRHEEHYGVKTSLAKRIYMQLFDFSTRSLKNNINARHGVLFVDNEVAAFFSGYYDKKTDSIIVPRLSFDPSFERYSPGYLLIHEAIRVLSKSGGASCIDLAQGIEKYKLDLGGSIYCCNDYSISRTQ